MKNMKRREIDCWPVGANSELQGGRLAGCWNPMFV